MNDRDMNMRQVYKNTAGAQKGRARGKSNDKSNDFDIQKKTLAARGIELLKKYKDAKSSLEQRIIADELFWRQRYNDFVAGNETLSNGEAKRHSDIPRPTSAWLFNAVINKHADLMDSYPSAVCLPRERSDEDAAKMLSSIIPVIMQRCGFEKTYSDNSYYKIKHGTCAYGVFWDSTLENGFGDISIKPVDLLNLFWEPGISELEQSKNVFCVTLCDMDDIKSAYPDSGFKGGGNLIDVAKYILDDHVDTSDKVLVVDWYYKKRVGEKVVVHFCKLAGDTVLYSSEDDPDYCERGFYDHGRYPFVLDVMYPESRTPYGFGIISVTKNAQVYIDRLDRNILENSLMQSKVRYFIKKSASINKDEFLDWDNPLVEVSGNMDETNVRPITVPTLDSIIVSVREAKINEMKETSANRDVNSGGTTGGVTSGAAIATLQEAGNKVSRDVINASYRAYVEIVNLVIELMRQFYTESRTFRIVEPNSGSDTYVDFSNAQISEEKRTVGGEVMYRVPIFDIDVRAEKHSPYARLSQNETIMNLYNLGFFNPENAQAASVALDALEFEGKDRILDRIKEGDTLLNLCKQLQSQLSQLAAQVDGIKAQAIAQPQTQAQAQTQANSDLNSSQEAAFGREEERQIPESIAVGQPADRNAMAAREGVTEI